MLLCVAATFVKNALPGFLQCGETWWSFDVEKTQIEFQHIHAPYCQVSQFEHKNSVIGPTIEQIDDRFSNESKIPYKVLDQVHHQIWEITNVVHAACRVPLAICYLLRRHAARMVLWTISYLLYLSFANYILYELNSSWNETPILWNVCGLRRSSYLLIIPSHELYTCYELLDLPTHISMSP